MDRGSARRGGVPAGVIAPVLFLVSGMCALMDEVLWARALGTVLGASYDVQALVLGVFFAAIPLGAALGTRWVRKHGPRRLWLCYAAVEGTVSVAALAPASLAAGAFRGASLGAETAAAYLVLALLVIPGACVGAAWPLMAALSRGHGGRLGTLYAVNTLGAALGALIASLFLLERLGVSGALLASAGLGLFATAAALIVSRKDSGDAPSLEPRDSDSSSESAVKHALASRRGEEVFLWYAGSIIGFFTIGYEVLGARLLSLRLTATTQSLALMLAIQLTGMALGACLIPVLVRRGARSLSLALVLAAIGTALAPIIAWEKAPPAPAESFVQQLFEAAVDAAIVLGPGALALGVVFPLATSLLSQRHPGDYARLGRLATASGAFGMLGAAVVAVVLVPAIGVAGSFVVMVLGLGLSASFALFKTETRRFGALVSAGLTAVSAWGAAQWAPTRVFEGETLISEHEGPMGTAAVVETTQGIRRLVVNGRYIMGDSASRLAARRMAFLPVLLQGDASRIFLVGLGTGITRGAVQEFASFNQGTLDVAEMMPEVVALSPHFAPWQARFAAGEGQLLVGDGRRILRSSALPYDLIIFDVVHPWQPGAALLYSREAFSLLRDRLTPQGRAVVWLPVYQLSPDAVAAIVRTFVSVFPRARLFAGGLDSSRQVLAIASQGAAAESVAATRERLSSAGVLDDPLLSYRGALAALDLGDASKIVDQLVAGQLVGVPDVQHDDRPWLEFEGARAHANGRKMGTAEFGELLSASDRAYPPSARPADAADVNHCMRAMWLDSTDAAREAGARHLLTCLAGPASRDLARQFAGMMARRASLAGDEQRAYQYRMLASAPTAPAGVEAAVAR